MWRSGFMSRRIAPVSRISPNDQRARRSALTSNPDDPDPEAEQAQPPVISVGAALFGQLNISYKE